MFYKEGNTFLVKHGGQCGQCGQCGRVVKAQGWDMEGPGFEPSHRNHLHT